jgi:predicted nucleic acid-binding protein
MARLILDTTVLIGWFRDTQEIRDWVIRTIAGTDVLGVCPINLAEIYTRAHSHERQRWQELLATLHHWDVTMEDGISAGIMRYALARQGFQAGFQDSLIASVASRVGASVVTTNVKDFELLDVPVVRPA